MTEQGAGGPLDRSQRNLPASVAGLDSDGDSIPDTSDQMPHLIQNEQKSKPELTRNSDLSSIAPAWGRTPPVTRATLSELDLSEFSRNLELRHNINFDPQLRFRPNLDGKKGHIQEMRANQFWSSLEGQLTMFTTDRPGFYDAIGSLGDWTLPTLLKTIEEIIPTLIPMEAVSLFKKGFDVELLMQQLHKGCADLDKFAWWLSQFLKTHCAPMRDDWIDTMCKQLRNTTSDLRELVNGLRSLLGVVEAMALDLANHQIRCLRPTLIEDTTRFEREFFRKRIDLGGIDTSSASRWYNDAVARYTCPSTNSAYFGETGAFFEALSRLIMPSSTKTCLPSTFLLDESRIEGFRAAMRDAINLEICMRMYEDLEHNDHCATSGHFASSTADTDIIRCSTSPGAEFNCDTPLDSSRPFITSLSPSGFRHSSRNKSCGLYSSLVALLQSADPEPDQSTRWRSIVPSVGLQMLRCTKAQCNTGNTLVQKLYDNVCDMNSPLYKKIEESFQTRLMAKLGICVRAYQQLSGLQLFSAATGGFQSDEHHRAEDVVKDIAVRLAHLGILHWRVWQSMVYVQGDGMVVDSEN